jgi:hypothetical protein
MKTACRGAAVLVALVLSACAAPGTRVGSGPPPTEAPGPSGHNAVVPEVTGEELPEARMLLTRAKLVPVIRYAPEVLVNAGAVMLSMPKGGAPANAGDVVVLVVAGKPDAAYGGTPGAKALNDLAAAREEAFVGIGFPGGNAQKPLVVALAPGVDPSMWTELLATAAGDQKYTVRQCDHTLAELRQIQAELLAGPHETPFTAAVRPAECAVYVTGPDAAQAQQRYGSAVVAQNAR